MRLKNPVLCPIRTTWNPSSNNALALPSFNMVALSLLAIASYAISCINASPVKRASWPNGPFYTEGEKILDQSGNSIKYAGVNWPGHGETMVPEGLQYQSISKIVAEMKSIGINAIRLTYAIQMIDQIYENDGTDVTLQTAFTEGLGETNGTIILNKVLANNPSFTAETTRLEASLWGSI